MNNISATVVCDSIADVSPRLTTVELRYPFHAHHRVMAHRQFSRNTGLGQPFFRSNTDFTVCTLVTAVDREWDRFLVRRQFKDNTDLNALALCVRQSLAESVPVKRDAEGWHLPYIDETTLTEIALYAFDTGPELGLTIGQLGAAVERLACKVSVARCAHRPSDPMYGMRGETIGDQVGTADALMCQSPPMAHFFEHQAQPDYFTEYRKSSDWAHKHLHGNLTGWQQYRKMFVGELGSIVTATRETSNGIGDSHIC